MYMRLQITPPVGDFIIDHLPWLVGSLGTVSLDMFIFCQFLYYGRGDGVPPLPPPCGAPVQPTTMHPLCTCGVVSTLGLAAAHPPTPFFFFLSHCGTPGTDTVTGGEKQPLLATVPTMPVNAGTDNYPVDGLPKTPSRPISKYSRPGQSASRSPNMLPCVPCGLLLLPLLLPLHLPLHLLMPLLLPPSCSILTNGFWHCIGCGSNDCPRSPRYDARSVQPDSLA